MTRPHLVLLHSFPTNSVLLRGLIEFLDDYFTVHFVDLPGFTRQVPPLEDVSIQGYAEFLRNRIDSLALPEYLLGGISFGFLVANFFPPGPECKGILAIEPLLGVASMRMKRRKQLILRTLLSSILMSHSERRVWNSAWFRRRILASASPSRSETLLRELDPHTFFATAELLLRWDRPISFHPIRYVLLFNPNDTTIKAEYVRRVFESEVPELLISTNSIDHYPDTISKDYFVGKFSVSELERIQTFIYGSHPKGQPT